MRRNEKTRVPGYLLHRGKGLAYVNFSGHVIYLGPYGSDPSRAKYRRLIAEWAAGDGRPPGAATIVADVLAAFHRWAKRRYVDRDGKASREGALYDGIIDLVAGLYATVRVEAFGPLQLQAVREAMIARGWTRKSINRQVGRVRRIFSWGVANGLVDEPVAAALDRVEGIRRGQRDVPEGRPVTALDAGRIDAVKDQVSDVVAAMIDVQRLTGMRPGELVIMRPGDLDRTDAVWIYTPAFHKTAHAGRERIVAIGPRAQEVLAPFVLGRAAEAYVFDPREAMAERLAVRAAGRTTPDGYGNRPGTNRKRRPKNPPGRRYTTASYRKAIAAGCDRAWPPIGDLARKPTDRSIAAWTARIAAAGLGDQLRAWRRAHRWHPHQLRHTFTTVAGELDVDLEATAAALGHASPSMTMLYRHAARQKAAAVAAAIG